MFGLRSKCSGIFKWLLCVGIVSLSISGRAAATSKFVYVTNRSSNNISAFSINAASGALTPVPGSPFAAGSFPNGVAVDPSGNFVYAANGFSRSVSAYAINATTGALTPVAGSPFAAGAFPHGVAADPSGKFVYVANASSNDVSAYTIDATSGALTPVPGSPFAASLSPHGVAVDPSGKFAYVTNNGSNSVSAYTIDATSGALTAVPGYPLALGPGPFGVAVDPSGKFVYEINGISGSVSAYAINATTGALTPVAGSPFAAGPGPFGVAVDPSGKFVYVTDRNTLSANNLFAYTIGASNGALTPVAGSPFAGIARIGMATPQVAVDPSGKFVYVTNASSNDVSAYTINGASGALTPVPGSPFAAGPGPFGIAVTPNHPPVADAGDDQMIPCTSPTGTSVTLDGSGSSDPDEDVLSFAWTGPFPEGSGTTTGESPMVTLALGTSTVTLVVNDGQVDSEPDTVAVTVKVGVAGFQPPLTALVPQGDPVLLPDMASKQGRTLPLKLKVFCGTIELNNLDITPPLIVGLLRNGDALDLGTVDPDAGQANDSGLLFRFADGQWVYNLNTKGLSTGTYIITVQMPDGLRYSAGFVLR